MGYSPWDHKELDMTEETAAAAGIMFELRSERSKRRGLRQRGDKAGSGVGWEGWKQHQT